jgi:hypothetical protein
MKNDDIVSVVFTGIPKIADNIFTGKTFDDVPGGLRPPNDPTVEASAGATTLTKYQALTIVLSNILKQYPNNAKDLCSLRDPQGNPVPWVPPLDVSKMKNDDIVSVIFNGIPKVVDNIFTGKTFNDIPGGLRPPNDPNTPAPSGATTLSRYQGETLFLSNILKQYPNNAKDVCALRDPQGNLVPWVNNPPPPVCPNPPAPPECKKCPEQWSCTIM